MSDELIADKAYEALKALVLSGEFLPGAWIKLSDLQRRLQLGTMPLRLACRTLAAEGFVESHPHRGLYVRNLHAREMQAKLEVLRDDLLSVVNWAIQHPERVAPVALPTLPSDPAEAHEVLLVAIAGLSDNYFRQAQVRTVAARLRLTRRIEESLASSGEEFELLIRAFRDRDYEELKRLLSEYFQHRVDAIKEIILRIYELREPAL